MSIEFMRLYPQLSFWERVWKNETEGFSDDQKYQAYWNYMEIKRRMEK